MAGEYKADDLRGRITGIIQDVFQGEEYGFQVYVSMKTEPYIKEIVIHEGNPNSVDASDNFKRKVQLALEKAVRDKYIGESSSAIMGDETVDGASKNEGIDTELVKKYENVSNIANGQDAFYVIPQDEDYQPFSMLAEASSVSRYSAKDRESAQGIWFRFGRGSQIVWAYQHLYPNSVPNRRRRDFLLVPFEQNVFFEMKEPPLIISHRVDFLVIGNEIICDNIKLLQRSFHFQEYVKQVAEKVVKEIGEIAFVANMGKLNEYINNRNLAYARKIMRIKDSKVLEMRAEDLYEKITTLPRWKGIFDMDEGSRTIQLKTFKDVENLIDLLDERYTRSEVTGEEYDSGDGAKRWVKGTP